LDDTVMVECLNLPLLDRQRQFSILESHQFVSLASTFGPSHATRLTPKGMEALGRVVIKRKMLGAPPAASGNKA
jgi:hypothetical protein